MNGFTLLALIVFAIGVVVAYRAGVMRSRRSMRDEGPLRPLAVAPAATPPPRSPSPLPTDANAPTMRNVAAAPGAIAGTLAPAGIAAGSGDAPAQALAGERYRLVLSFEDEAATLRRARASVAAETSHLRELAEERRALLRALAAAREETARYRQILVDLENDAPPPLLDGPGAPDDLKLIVGVGPVLERMLQQLGVTSYRQIARWSERDIDQFDARLPEFHGRIRRDGWVTQARALHQSKYGEPPPPPRG